MEVDEGSEHVRFTKAPQAHLTAIMGGATVKSYFVYIMTNRPRGVLYTGFTGSLDGRVLQHKQKESPRSFTARYNCAHLVYFEEFWDPLDGIAREKEIKGWLREKKIALIEAMNPDWKDLSDHWFDEL